uniref:TSA: Wollemia nobilis Ref_Wollemi_Transcript_11548_3732 transcribed RNA sequence n=1 Tax=Wollemia nobilis TaxID=56998 RepID=A0A0C9RM11_9CONI
MEQLQREMESLFCNSLCSRLDPRLDELIPIVQQVRSLDMESPKDQQNPVYKKFLDILIKGKELVRKCENVSPLNVFTYLRNMSQLFKLEKEIDDFVQHQMPAATLLGMKQLTRELKDGGHVDMGLMNDLIYGQASKLTRELKDGGHVDMGLMNDLIYGQASNLTSDPYENTLMLQQMSMEGWSQRCETSCKGSQENPNFLVGMEKSMFRVKELLFQSDVLVVGVQCMGGGGKTTLALALCEDSEVKGFFGNNVFFFTVSQSPNLKSVLHTMWEKLINKKIPEFQNAEDAHIQLQQELLMQSMPILVVLDDVWSRAALDILLFEGPGYKTLVTTRDSSTIPKSPSTRLYQLPLLEPDDALSLFCFWAFGQTTIPSTAQENLIKQVKAECRGLPLALKVIGSCLHGQPSPAWESAKNKLSRAEKISDYHKEGLLGCLETSIDFLDEEARECFLDLGAFPEDKKICADALLDIWVYVRKLEWQDAFVILLELASRNLLTLTTNLGSQAITYGSALELYFSQHDVMRDLALYLASRDRIGHRKRLLMPKEESNLPGKWEELKDKTFDAQIVSINTGFMDENQWSEMNFPEAEALVLLFSASDYILPTFISTMRKLKVLLIINRGSKRATVEGIAVLSSLSKLKSIRLERLIVPVLQELSKALWTLEKLSLSLCEGLGNLSKLNKKLSLNFPIMLDFNLDHCCDLEELPYGLCDMSTIRNWSITNCHLVHKLPDDFGKFTSLRMLRLSACPGLKELPASICNLKQLEFLDISLCECLVELPEEIGQLKNLREIDMRECSCLKRVPKSVRSLRTLKHVICDEKIEQQWISVKKSDIPDLVVEAVEEHFTLDWLDD